MSSVKMLRGQSPSKIYLLLVLNYSFWFLRIFPVYTRQDRF